MMGLFLLGLIVGLLAGGFMSWSLTNDWWEVSLMERLRSQREGVNVD